MFLSYYFLSYFVKGSNLKVTIYPVIMNYQNCNNQTVTTKEFCHRLQITLLWSKQLCAVGKLITGEVKSVPPQNNSIDDGKSTAE